MNKCRDRTLSAAEVGRVEAGLPRLQDWSDRMLVPFSARRLLGAYPIWINSRWFLERNMDLGDTCVRERVSNWLVDEFAYAVPRDGDSPEHFSSETITLHADRYGSTTGKSVHGGSGRVATIGCFQAKGIGVTTLAGFGANWVHSNGCASIEETVREAIYSEIAAAEFPHGGIPVIAILDTGMYFSDPQQSHPKNRTMRRAIIIRPAVLRLAHAQRAPLFTRSLTGYKNSQLDDVRRAKDVISNWLLRTREDCFDGRISRDLATLAERIAEQVAFGQVQRLYSGGYFSSNLTATGALLDFGGMRSLPTWVNARTLDQVVGFGEEMNIVLSVLRSLVFHFNKFRPSSVPPFSALEITKKCTEAHTRAFASECLRVWGMSASVDELTVLPIVRAVRQYFAHQQTAQVNYKHGNVCPSSWIYDAIAEGLDDVGNITAESQVIDAIQKALQAHFASMSHTKKRIELAWSTALRYLMPRRLLDRELLQSQIDALVAVENPTTKIDHVSVGKLICSMVGKSRRHWPRIPGDLRVQAHVTCEGSSALRCVEMATEEPILWLEGPFAQGVCYLFGSKLPLEAAREVTPSSDGCHWTARIDASLVTEIPAMIVKLKEHCVEIPPMQVRYPPLNSRLRDAIASIASTDAS